MESKGHDRCERDILRRYTVGMGMHSPVLLELGMDRLAASAGRRELARDDPEPGYTA